MPWRYLNGRPGPFVKPLSNESALFSRGAGGFFPA
jgi:hypothetical protein